jgi:hypothetical protein
MLSMGIELLRVNGGLPMSHVIGQSRRAIYGLGNGALIERPEGANRTSLANVSIRLSTNIYSAAVCASAMLDGGC